MEWKFLMVRYIYTWDTILFDRNIFSPDESLRINLSKCNIDWKSLNSYFWFCTNIEWLGLRPEFTVPVQEMAKQELSECLKKFYLCIRKKDGSFFKVSSLKAIRAAVDRFLKSVPNNNPWSITSDPQFKQANDALDAFAKSIRREGKLKLAVSLIKVR